MRLSLLVLFCLQYLIMAGNWWRSPSICWETDDANIRAGLLNFWKAFTYTDTHTDMYTVKHLRNEKKSQPNGGKAWRRRLLAVIYHQHTLHGVRYHTPMWEAQERIDSNGVLFAGLALDPLIFSSFLFFPSSRDFALCFPHYSGSGCRPSMIALHRPPLSLSLCTHCLWTRVSHGHTHTHTCARALAMWMS